MRLAFLILLIFLLSPFTLALEVVESKAKYSQWVATLVANKIKPALANLDAKQQARLEQVKIKVVNDLIAADIAFSIDGKYPRILINNRFIEGLDAYTEAYLIASQRGKPNLPELFFHHYLWSRHPDYSGIESQSPLLFFGLPKAQHADLLKRKAALLENALIDIVLHELGHHAEQAFYSYRSPFNVKKVREEEADDWALAMKSQHFSELDFMGRLLSLAFVFERDRWITLSTGESYSATVHWLVENTYKACDKAQKDHVLAFCNQLSTNLSLYYSNQAEQAYQARIDGGEEYANFPLAQILLQKSRYHLACSYFKESHDSGNIKRAAVYVAWCYMNGFLQPSPPDAQILALSQSNQALMSGYMDTRQYINTLNQYHELE